MSFLSQIKKKAKKLVSSRNLAIVAPVYAGFTKAGRRQLKKIYGGVASNYVNAATAGQGGAFVTAALDAAAPDHRADAESAAPALSAQDQTYNDPNAKELPPWLIPAGVAGVALVAFLIVRGRK